MPKIEMNHLDEVGIELRSYHTASHCLIHYAIAFLSCYHNIGFGLVSYFVHLILFMFPAKKMFLCDRALVAKKLQLLSFVEQRP